MKTGDVVQLKSGGPFMTVIATECVTPDSVRCCWFEHNDFRREYFPECALLVLDDYKPTHPKNKFIYEFTRY